MKLDDTDKRLLTLLQENSKTSTTELSSKLNLTKTPIYDRIRRYENSGLVEKYVAVLNPEKIEKSMTIFCSVSLDSQKLDRIETFSKSVKELPEVLECYLMGGANDFLLKVVVEDLDAYHQFSSGKLAALKNVAQIKSTFVLDEVKKSTVLPLF